MGRSKKKKVYLTVISIKKGIIMLIESDGRISYYRQRGLDDLSLIGEKSLINSGRLSENWRSYKELPCNYRLSYEDSEIQGKASTYFQFKKNTKDND